MGRRSLVLKTTCFAEFALIRTAAGKLNAFQEILFYFGQFVGGNREIGHGKTITGLEDDLLRRIRIDTDSRWKTECFPGNTFLLRPVRRRESGNWSWEDDHWS